jgi:hypothetical protein
MIQTKPCIHIRSLLSPLMDSRLSGVLGAYVHWHVERCPRCQTALDNLREIVGHLSARSHAPFQPTLGVDRWAKLEAAWDAAERSD